MVGVELRKMKRTLTIESITGGKRKFDAGGEYL